MVLKRGPVADRCTKVPPGRPRRHADQKTKRNANQTEAGLTANEGHGSGRGPRCRPGESLDHEPRTGSEEERSQAELGRHVRRIRVGVSPAESAVHISDIDRCGWPLKDRLVPLESMDRQMQNARTCREVGRSAAMKIAVSASSGAGCQYLAVTAESRRHANRLVRLWANARVRVVVVAVAVSGAVLGIVLSSVGGSAARLPEAALPSASSACVSPLASTAPASPGALRGYTYMLARPPSGYEILSEAGTVNGSGCPGAVWWSVNYDRVNGATMLSGVVVIVTSAAAGVAVNPRLAAGSTAVPTGSATPGQSDVIVVMPGSHRGLFHDLGDGVGRLVWIANGLTFAVDGPISGGQPDALLNLAKTLTLVNSTTPAIEACLSQLRGPCEDPS